MDVLRGLLQKSVPVRRNEALFSNLDVRQTTDIIDVVKMMGLVGRGGCAIAVHFITPYCSPPLPPVAPLDWAPGSGRSSGCVAVSVDGQSGVNAGGHDG